MAEPWTKPILWTKERTDQLTALWADLSRSGSSIADEIGGGISRSAVISKARRMGLPKRSDQLKPASASRPRKMPKKPPPKLPVKLLKPIIPIPPPPLPVIERLPGQGIGLFEFTDYPDAPRHCRWPINWPQKGEEYLFCGEPTQFECSYCPQHMTRALNGTNPWGAAA